jgi:hypothetical protein
MRPHPLSKRIRRLSVKISNHYVSKIVFVLLFVEVLVLLGAAYAGAAVRFMDRATMPSAPRPFLHLGRRLRAAIMFSMSAMGMYQLDFNEGLRNPFFMKLMPSFAMGFLILTLVFYVAPELYFGRGILVLVFALAAGRHLHRAHDLLQDLGAALPESRIMFLGGGPLAKECSDLAEQRNSYHRYDIAGFIPIPGRRSCACPPANLLKMRDGDSLVSLARQYNVEEIVVSVQNRRGGFPIKELLDCKLQGMKVTDAATFFERETCQIRVDSLQPSWLVFGGGFDQSFMRTFMKRSFDLVCSVIILALTLPVMLLAALADLAGRPRPMFYSQERVGKDGKTFKVQIPQHAHRRRKGRQAAVGRRRTTRASPASATSCARPASTSCRRS